MKRRINGSGWLEGLFLEVWDRSRGSNLIEIWRRKNWEKAQQDHGPVIAQLRKKVWKIFDKRSSTWNTACNLYRVYVDSTRSHYLGWGWEWGRCLWLFTSPDHAVGSTKGFEMIGSWIWELRPDLVNPPLPFPPLTCFFQVRWGPCLPLPCLPLDSNAVSLFVWNRLSWQIVYQTTRSK